MAFRNLVSDGNWWTFDVQDATGTWYTLGKSWALSEADAIAGAEKVAETWSTYPHDPVESAKMVEQIKRDYKTRTYHGD